MSQSRSGTGRIGAVVVALIAGAIAASWFIMRPSPQAPPSAPPVRVELQPIEIVEVEPNDSSPQTIVSLPATITGQLAPGDRDRFRVTIDLAGGVLLDARLDPPTIRARLELRQIDGRVLQTVETPARLGNVGVIRGGYDLLVEGIGAPGTASAPYRLLVDQRPWHKGLDWEPDDDSDHAQELRSIDAAPGEISHLRAIGSWSHPGDTDCFVVPLSVPAAGAVVKLALSPPAGVSARMAVLDSGDPEAKVARREIARTASPVAGEGAVIPALGARSWEPSYVVCTSAATGVDFAGRYELDIRSFTPDGPFEFEPNGAPEEPSALPHGVSVGGYLTDGDIDWYLISAGPAASRRAQLTLPKGVEAELALLDEGRNVLASDSGGGRELVAASPMKRSPATFVRIRSVRGSDSTNRYRLILESERR